jgi:quinol monooxygenase YgiN
MAILVHAEIHGLAGRASELRDLLAEHAELTARAPGSLGSSAYEPLGAEFGELVLDAWWRDDAALRAHFASAEYSRYGERVGELLARPSDVSIHYIERSVRATADLSQDPTRQG